MTEDEQALRDLFARLMVRVQSENFDPKNMRFNMNATPIMRELHATAGNESDEVLKALLEEYKVRVIPSEDFPELASYLRVRNANALRNTLSRLGWEASRLRFEGRQHRVWIAQGTSIEEGRVRSTELAASYSDIAEELGYTWFNLAFFVHRTWKALRGERLNKAYGKSLESYAAVESGLYANSNGEYGPYKSSRSHLTLHGHLAEMRFAREREGAGDEVLRI